MIIAQITDTHIKAGKLAYRRVDTNAALARCIAHVNILQPRPDVVLLTGDLTDFGRPEEYALLRELLLPLQMPWYLIPGNHDDRDALRAAFPEHAYLPAAGFLQFAVDGYPVRLIGLDSTVLRQDYGELCDRRLAWLDGQLRAQPERPTVLFMHHPPFVTGIAHMDAQNCRDGARLGALLERHRQVRALLCGHVHRPIHTVWHGVLAAIGPSPAHAVALDLGGVAEPGFVLEPPACQLLMIDAAGSALAHLSFIGDFEGPHPFFDEHGRLID